jgi:predicted RNA-binding protein (virulence factor B family)
MSNTWKSDNYYVWLRVDKETRKMGGLMMHTTLERTLEWAKVQFGDRPFEIDNGGNTVYVSELSKVILNGGQFGLFGS